MHPSLSIIIPVFQAEKYLRPCIDSVLNQSFPDFELILINDGSMDQSGDICDEYARADARIKVIHQENKGQAAARNRGVDNSSGGYV
jgi:glycosyltransferase involved in cell wall biosynthesis